jgi:pilus assembly protein Flp/PilA
VQPAPGSVGTKGLTKPNLPAEAGTRTAVYQSICATNSWRKSSGTPGPVSDEGGWEPERRHQVERAKLIPMRAYLALTALRDREEGQAMVEYALILALVSVAAVGILSVLGKSVSSIFSEINQDL